MVTIIASRFTVASIIMGAAVFASPKRVVGS